MLGAGLWLLAGCTWAADVPRVGAAPVTIGAAAAEQLHAALRFDQALVGRFEQKVFDERGQLLQEQSGTLAAQRPGKLRWEVLAPAPFLLVADGKSAWFYDAELGQVTVRELSGDGQEAPFLVLTGDVDGLLAAFDLAST